MNSQIALILVQGAIVSGAVYTLLALAMVLVFSVTRVILVPQGEFVAIAALTLAALQEHRVPNTIWLLLAMGLATFVVEAFSALRERRPRGLIAAGLAHLGLPLALAALVAWTASRDMPQMVPALLSVAIVAPLGPMIYRLAFQRLANGSVLVLLVVAVAVHFVLTGLGLILYGAEGSRSHPLAGGMFDLGPVMVTMQSLIIVGTTGILIVGLLLFFGRSMYGKLLRATAIHRLGARLVGISPTQSGKIAFGLASLIGGVSGVLAAPITTVYYDTGFLIGLKGLVGAIFGGLVSYPMAALGAFLVAFLESFGSFEASAYKEVIIFTLIVPVLFWRSLFSRLNGEEEVEEEDDL